MSADEGSGFVIRDRRGRSDESDAASKSQAPGSASERSAKAAGSEESAHAHEAGPPVTFSTFVFSLGTSALMLMGEQLDPRQAKLPVNLAQAKEIIDILSMLEEKSRGNLNAEEQTVLTDMLYALRMKYVDVASPPGGPGSRPTTASK